MPDEMTFPLNLPADLPKNRLSFRRRIGSFGDGAADHDVAGARGNSFGNSDHANLIGYAAPGGTDPRGHDGESVSEFRAQSRGFAGGGDYALAAIGQRDSGEAYDAVLDRAPKSDRFQVAAVHAGENGDGEHDQIWAGACRLHGSAQHFAAAGGMNCQHADPKLRRFGHPRPNGVGNVVILQVEKNMASAGHEIAHDLWTLGGVELHADFIGQGGIPHRRHDLLRGGGSGDV